MAAAPVRSFPFYVTHGDGYDHYEWLRDSGFGGDITLNGALVSKPLPLLLDETAGSAGSARENFADWMMSVFRDPDAGYALLEAWYMSFGFVAGQLMPTDLVIVLNAWYTERTGARNSGHFYAGGPPYVEFGEHPIFGSCLIRTADVPTWPYYVRTFGHTLLINEVGSGVPDFQVDPTYANLHAGLGWAFLFNWVDNANFCFFTPYIEGAYGRVAQVVDNAVTWSLTLPLVGSMAPGARSYNGFTGLSAPNFNDSTHHGVQGMLGWGPFDAGGAAVIGAPLLFGISDRTLVIVQEGVATIGAPSGSANSGWTCTTVIPLPRLPTSKTFGFMEHAYPWIDQFLGDEVIAPITEAPVMFSNGVLPNPAVSAGIPPLRLAQRDDGAGPGGHARLPLVNSPTSIQTPGPRISGRNQYL